MQVTIAFLLGTITGAGLASYLAQHNQLTQVIQQVIPQVIQAYDSQIKTLQADYEQKLLDAKHPSNSDREQTPKVASKSYILSEIRKNHTRPQLEWTKQRDQQLISLYQKGLLNSIYL